MGVSGNLWSFLKEVNPLVLYDVDRGMALESIQGKQPSSRVDLGYTETLRLPAVTSVSFKTCDSVLGDSLEFCQAYLGSLHVLLGIRNFSGSTAGEYGLISHRGGSLMVFLELRREPGLYSRVTAGMNLQRSCLFSEVRTPVSLRGTPQESPRGLASNTDAS